jgi:hypothetical protein
LLILLKVSVAIPLGNSLLTNLEVRAKEPWFEGTASPPNLNPISDGAIAAMRTWLEVYTPSSVSDPRIADRIMPKRLLKLESDGGMVSLVEPGPAQPYALLSYCWGGDQSTKTTKSNLTSHMRGIHTGSLSQSIRDAVRISRLIKVTHLWVDALCMFIVSKCEYMLTGIRQGIVQDDTDELQQEIANQAKIYQNGVVTILAGGASSAQEGFLHRREQLEPRCSINLEVQNGSDVSLLLDPEPQGLKKIFSNRPKDPVSNRAWM